MNATAKSLTSLVLKDPSVKMRVASLFKLLINVPDQLQVLRIEHLIEATSLYSPDDHLHRWNLDRTTWNMTRTPRPENPCNLDECNCRCITHLMEIWSNTTPTQNRVLALFAITNTQQSRPVVMPFLTYRCPNLRSIKIKDPGLMPFAT
ncbi:hypothetical protein BG015_002166 [Linnemannia schmuckeri]|uniref:Uncharacterized protein n=1 Tax=Linnemannia schmuckeri TaxID=64567 RepID=A0A9P5RPD0_9FUNG|nr:hypothetical protein BG015_002166 [Linnemannia schmuckeri]